MLLHCVSDNFFFFFCFGAYLLSRDKLREQKERVMKFIYCAYFLFDLNDDDKRKTKQSKALLCELL